jgi:NADH dehydrogenase [ubiquinone] 1 alpha subcomplex assembly factor 6
MPTAGTEEAAGYCLDQVRRFDRDRYLTALFAPADRRVDLLALYAFNVEVARIRELIREPMMGHVRLQWWRDAIAEIYAGRERRHQVVHGLAPAVRRHGLSRGHFDRLLDAREQDMSMEAPTDLPALVAYAQGTAGSLGLLAVEILGGSATRTPHADSDVAVAAAAANAWTAHALVGLLRAVPYHARQHRIYLPQSLLAEHGVAPHDLLDLRPGPGLAVIARDVAAAAERLLDDSRRAIARPPRPLASAFLAATLARADLARLQRANFDPFDSRPQQPAPARIWRLLWSSLHGRY